jgi:hypothetical protein
MYWTRIFLVTSAMLSIAIVAIASPPHHPSRQQTLSSHDRVFWRSIVQDNYRVPPGQSAFALIHELNNYLGTPDPELRDDLAYTLMDAWIVYQQQLSGPELISLLGTWQSNLREGIGETGTDTVLKRSFSALCLAMLAERDLKSPFLGEARYRSLLNAALAYMKDERDLRGFDPVKSWIHATAHTADLLAFLAANPLLKVEDQRSILQAVSERLSSAHLIFSYGEQDRLAASVVAIIERRDFDNATFHRWLAALDESDRQVWKSTPPNDDLLKTFQNNSYLLQALTSRLGGKPRSPGITTALDQLTPILKSR